MQLIVLGASSCNQILGVSSSWLMRLEQTLRPVIWETAHVNFRIIPGPHISVSKFCVEQTAGNVQGMT